MEAHQPNSPRTERVVFETDRQLVSGDMTLPLEGYQARFSDAVNRPDVGFIPLLNVEITPLAGGEVVRHEFLVLSKSHIRMAYPLAGAG